jgi:hypothetical protein
VRLSEAWTAVVDAGRRLVLHMHDQGCAINPQAAARCVLRRFDSLRDSGRLQALLVDELQAYACSLPPHAQA